MFKCRSLLFFLLVIALTSFILFYHDSFPIDSDSLVLEKYEGWSGVLRIWVCEGWKTGTGSINGWLNLCSSSFEKKHNGVYIQMQHVDRNALIGMCENGIIPPDMIIFPPHVLGSPKHLIPLEVNDSLRHSLIYSGSYDGIIYAQPILMGGYIWAYNTSFINSIPNTWKNSTLPVAIPVNDSHHNWNAALMGICSSVHYENSEKNISDYFDPGIDLGLSIIEPTSTPITSKDQHYVEAHYCQLSDCFVFSSNAYLDFIDGRAASIPITQYEICDLEKRTSLGKCPDWQLSITGNISFSDQILYAAVLDQQTSFEKHSLCEDFISHILSEDCQKQLYRTGAFSVTQTESGYPGYDALTNLEYMLQNNDLCITPAFDTEFSEKLDIIVQNFIDNKGFSEQLLKQFENISH